MRSIYFLTTYYKIIQNQKYIKYHFPLMEFLAKEEQRKEKEEEYTTNIHLQQILHEHYIFLKYPGKIN